MAQNPSAGVSQAAQPSEKKHTEQPEAQTSRPRSGRKQQAPHPSAPRSAARWSAAQRSAAQESAAQRSAAQESAAQRSAAQESAAQESAAQESAAQRPAASRSLSPRSSGGHGRAAASPASRGASDPSTGQQRIRIGGPVGLLAAVPVLLSFEPSDSLVVIGTEPPRARVRLTLRYDLPDPPDAGLAAGIARHALSVLAAQRIHSVVAVGYGGGHLVTPLADALREQAPRAGITVTELLRAENQRYWSYMCSSSGCCPPDGTPFNVSDHPVTRAFAAAGAASVLASRAALAGTVAPVAGDLAEAMNRATRKAEKRLVRLLARLVRSGRRGSARNLIATAGVQAVATTIGRYRHGHSVGPEIAAWLLVVLRDLRVRDDAWSRMLPEHQQAHLRLWTDLTRMARPGYVSAPASLLAFVAWQSGNGALANVALDRALDDDPLYSMASLLRQALDSGAPPSLARPPMTPEEVAASYDAQEREADAGESAEGGADDDAADAAADDAGDGAADDAEDGA